MNEEQMEALGRACMIIGESLSRAFDEIAAAIALFADNITDIVDDVMVYYEVDSVDEFQRAIERIKESANLADYAEEIADIDREEIPRPPKKIGPVNKVNYTYNRPQRRARSNCHSVRR